MPIVVFYNYYFLPIRSSTIVAFYNFLTYMSIVVFYNYYFLPVPSTWNSNLKISDGYQQKKGRGLGKNNPLRSQLEEEKKKVEDESQKSEDLRNPVDDMLKEGLADQATVHLTWPKKRGFSLPNTAQEPSKKEAGEIEDDSPILTPIQLSVQRCKFFYRLLCEICTFQHCHLPKLQNRGSEKTKNLPSENASPEKKRKKLLTKAMHQNQSRKKENTTQKHPPTLQFLLQRCLLSKQLPTLQFLQQ